MIKALDLLDAEIDWGTGAVIVYGWGRKTSDHYSDVRFSRSHIESLAGGIRAEMGGKAKGRPFQYQRYEIAARLAISLSKLPVAQLQTLKAETVGADFSGRLVEAGLPALNDDNVRKFGAAIRDAVLSERG